MVNVDWFFESHRLPVALRLLELGAQVSVVTSVTDRGAALASAGLEVVHMAFTRSGRGVNELTSVARRLRAVLDRSEPDLIHNITVKPVLTSSIAAASLDRNLPIVNAISGFGHLLSDPEVGTFVPAVTRAAYRVALRAPRRTAVVVQNQAALADMVVRRLARPSDLRLIPGMGVDVSRFRPSSEGSSEQPIVMLASRMIASKGVREFAQAAQLVRQRNLRARFVLVGPPDFGNPLSLGEQDLRQLERDYEVEWWGASGDMAATLRRADVFVLPTYHEGLPKVLLEAAATGLPIVASDIPGCREVVEGGRDALLVQPRDVLGLSEAISHLLTEERFARELGAAARQKVESKFTVEQAVEAHLDVYGELLV